MTEAQFTKVCTKCRQEKPVSAFFLDKRRQKPRAKCKECLGEAQRLYLGFQYRQKTPERFWRRVDMTTTPEGCWVWTGGKNAQGYGSAFWDREHSRRAHVVAWFLTYGRWPTQDVLHICDNPPCCRPEHLYEGNDLDNSRDRIQRGLERHVSGEEHPQAKLTWTQVEAIRQLVTPDRHTRKVLAILYGVCEGTIFDIVKGKTWRKYSCPNAPHN